MRCYKVFVTSKKAVFPPRMTKNGAVRVHCAVLLSREYRDAREQMQRSRTHRNTQRCLI